MEDNHLIEEGTPEETRDSNEAKRPSSSQSARSRHRVPSALTVENVRKHEEETDAINVVELMPKNGHKDADHEEKPAGESHSSQEEHTEEMIPTKLTPLLGSIISRDSEESLECPIPDRSATSIELARKTNEITQLLGDMWLQPKRQTVEPILSPGTREETRGFKFTGEEYVAVSVDVQTDESFIAEAFQFESALSIFDHDLDNYQSKPALAKAATDERKSFSLERRRRKRLPSDLSAMDIADQESALHITESGISDDLVWRKQLPSDLSATDIADLESALHTTETDISDALVKTIEHSEDSDTSDENVVNDITKSEFGGFESATHISHGTARIIPGVGPPCILRYKPESQMLQLDYAGIDLSVPKDLNWNEMSFKQRDYYQAIMKDMKQLRMDKSSSLMQEERLISIEPHSAYGSLLDRKLAKERERERIRMRKMKKQSKQGGHMMANFFYAFARQLKTSVNYSLSSDKCMEEGWTIRPMTPVTPEQPPTEFFVYDPSQEIVSDHSGLMDRASATGPKYQHMFVKKLYPCGSIFLTVFSDGTGNVWYPSGSIACSIIASEKIGKMIFIVHEDINPAQGENIQAIFDPTGCCTCYYPSGFIRLLLTPLGGEYYGQQGERLKRWLWRDTQTQVHAPPFKPITFALSKRVGVRILSQESIYITFTACSRSVRFNAGTRLWLKPATFLPKIRQIDADQVVLNEKRFCVQSIIERIQNSLKFPNSPRLKKIQLPNYLTAQLDRNAKLRERLDKQQAMKPNQREKIVSLENGSSANTAPSENIQTLKGKNKRRLRFPRKKNYKVVDEFQPTVIVN